MDYLVSGSVFYFYQFMIYPGVCANHRSQIFFSKLIVLYIFVEFTINDYPVCQGITIFISHIRVSMISIEIIDLK